MDAFSFSLVPITSNNNPVEGEDSTIDVCGIVFFFGITLECDIEIEVSVIDTALAGTFC